MANESTTLPPSTLQSASLSLLSDVAPVYDDYEPLDPSAER